VSELWEVSGMIRSCMGVEDCELLEDVGVNGSVLELRGFLLLRVVSVRRCGNKWNRMKGMVGNVFVVMLEVSRMLSECMGFVLQRNCECRMMRG
jgi:hypothetical protein